MLGRPGYARQQLAFMMKRVAGDTEDIEYVVSQYFGILFSSLNPTPEYIGQALLGIDKKVTEDMNRMLNEVPTAKEIKDALDDMHQTKASGLDVIHTLLYKNAGIS